MVGTDAVGSIEDVILEVGRINLGVPTIVKFPFEHKRDLVILLLKSRGTQRHKYMLFFNGLHLRAMIYCLFSRWVLLRRAFQPRIVFLGQAPITFGERSFRLSPCGMSFGIGKNSFMIFFIRSFVG